MDSVFVVGPVVNVDNQRYHHPCRGLGRAIPRCADRAGQGCGEAPYKYRSLL